MSAPAPANLDAAQVIPASFDESNGALRVEVLSGLISVPYDSIALTYWASGNGVGQIETVQYYVGGLSGTLVGTLTLNYNSAANISSVVRT
jgi:hypothetical protein